MASLNTLRTKFGIVLSLIIAFALLAFILSLKTEMGFSGNDPKVGVMAGEKINYSEYYNRYEQIKSQTGAQESDEQQSAMLANATWQSLISTYVFEPGLERMGLQLTDAERLALLSGEQFSQTLYNAFADPRTGEYNVAAVGQFLEQADSDPAAQTAWQRLCEQLRLESTMTKYFGLVRGGAYVNKLEVEAGRKAANESYAGQWVGKRYAEVPDSLFEVSSGEIKSYYNAHKSAYKRTPSRSLSYVVFEVSPTDQDMEALEKEVRMVGEEFAAAEDPKSFARGNRFGSIAENFVTERQLTTEEAEALLAGKSYGPVLKNNQWTMARALQTKMAPDSLGLRHIVLSYTQEALADSLLTALRGGADFAEAARQHSLMAETAANGGEVGVMPFSAFTGEFIEALANAKTGDIVKIASGDAIQLMQVYRAGKPTKHVQVATITYPVEATSATRRAVHSQAGTFTVNAKKGGAEAFAEAATAAAVTPRTAVLVQGDRTIRGLEDSREVARWAYGAKKGDLSEIFKVGDDYVIATLTDINDDDYAGIREVAPQIRQQLLRDKKFDYIKGQLKGSTLEEMAASLGTEAADFADASYGAYYIAGPGLEPRLIGAIASAEKGKVSEPVKGLSGLYVFRVDSVSDSGQQSPEAEQVRAQAVLESMVGQYALQAVQQMAEIEDLRGKYF